MKNTIELHHKDLYADIAEHPNDIVGAWIKILCKIWLKNDRGVLKMTLGQIARVIGESTEDTDRILAYIGAENIACVERVGNQIEIINRRTARDSKEKLIPCDGFAMTPMGPAINQPAPAKQFTLQECMDAGFSIGLSDKESEDAFTHFNMQGWLRKNGMPITSLQSCMTYWRNHQHEFKNEKPTSTDKIKQALDYK